MFAPSGTTTPNVYLSRYSSTLVIFTDTPFFCPNTEVPYFLKEYGFKGPRRYPVYNNIVTPPVADHCESAKEQFWTGYPLAPQREGTE